MANMMDYLKWRGDLSFADAPFCEVDSLLLCYVSYVNLDGIAPQEGELAQTLSEMSRTFFKRYTKEELEKDKSFIRMAAFVMKEMAACRRFADTKVQNYVNLIDDKKNLQFSAVELILGDGTSFIAYRGTDDCIVGWKEDFFLSNGVVPAEKESVAYLNRVGGKNADGTSFIAYRGTDDCIVGWKEDFFLSNGVVPAEKESVAYLNRVGGKNARILRLGGHSKGGNLAIYAAAGCEEPVQKRLRVIYNLDGPGFTKDFLESPGLKKVLPKIRRYIPECSMIGTLLEHAATPAIIASSNKGVMQHDGLSWEVLGPSFVRCGELNIVAKIFDDAMSSWLSELGPEQKEAFINDFFSVLEATGAETLTQLQEGGIKNLKLMLKQIDTLKPETGEMLGDLIKRLAGHLPELLPFHK